MTDNVIKFGKAKKSLARQNKEKTAATNRARFGQKKSQKELKKALADKLQKKLDGHKVDAPPQSGSACDEKPTED